MSEMHQAMDTWLKTECQEAGSALLNALYSARGAFEASLDLNIPQRASVAEAHIKAVLPHAISRLAELPLDLLTVDERRVIFELEGEINEGLKGLELGQVSPETIINNLASLVGITEKYLLEKVVECQCGKPEEAEPTRFTKGLVVVIKPEFRHIYLDNATVTIVADDPKYKQVWVKEVASAVNYDHIEFVVTTPEEAKPPDPRNLKFKWHLKGEEAGKTETWIDVENTIKDTASRHPEIKDAWELVWADIEQWEGTDHFTINYGSGMWEDAKRAKEDVELYTDFYTELKSKFWEGYLLGRRETGRDIYAIANELVGGGSVLSNPKPEWLSLNKSQRREIIPILERVPEAREPVMVGEKRILEPLYDRAKEWADDPREWLLLSLSEKDADLVRDAIAKLS